MLLSYPRVSRLALEPRALTLVVASLLIAICGALLPPPQPDAPPSAPHLAFMPGAGGASPWEALSPHGALAFDAGGVSLTLPSAGGAAAARLNVSFVGAQASPALVGGERLPGVSNSYRGAPHEWRTGVPTYESVTYQSLYAGIDLRYDGREGGLKGTYTVAPGADPTSIRWRYQGAQAVTLDPASGDLHIALAGGSTLAERAPVAWQDVGGRQLPVAARFTLDGDLAGFALGTYDSALPLVIDPELVYGTYLGGGAEEYANGITLDARGFIYLTGRTYSNNFPATGGARASDRDIFVTKLDPTGKQVVYSTIIGGRNGDDGIAVAVNAAGEAVVTAYTSSDDFPLKNALLDTQPPNRGALLKLDAAGALAFSTYLNADLFGAHRNLGLDQAGNIYLTGTFDDNIVVGKISPDGEFLADQQIGGRWPDQGLALAVTPDGRVYVTGETDGWDNDFPTTPDALQPRCSERMDGGEASCDSEAVLVILEPTLEVRYSSYLGGGYLDSGSGIALDPQGNVVVVGTTFSSDFPTKNAVQPTCPDGESTDSEDACASFAGFVTKLSPDGKSILFSTYFSSPDWSADTITGVAVDRGGNIHLLGWTNSLKYPVKDGPQPNLTPGVCVNSISGTERMCEDAVITAFTPDGKLRYSTYLGGSGKEYPYGIAADAVGNIWVTGLTDSRDFPGVAGGFQPVKNLNSDIFLAKLGTAGTTPPPAETPRPTPNPALDKRVYLPLVRR